jgi:hypothetical protein
MEQKNVSITFEILQKFKRLPIKAHAHAYPNPSTNEAKAAEKRQVFTCQFPVSTRFKIH